jgi:hypothetical protein
VVTKAGFTCGVDAESFAISPNDFTRFLDRAGEDGRQFVNVLSQVGRPAFRLASMQRWDWRGRAETAALLASPLQARPKASVYYPYVDGQRFLSFFERERIAVIPMLDARFIYDATRRQVLRTPDASEEAIKQYAGGYARLAAQHRVSVTFWEIGNEEYQGNEMAAVDFAATAARYIQAVRQVSPQAKFSVPLNIWRQDWRQWSDRLLTALKERRIEPDFVTVHYYHPSAFTDRVTDETVDYLKARGFPRTKMAITEWRHSSQADEFDQGIKAAPLYTRFLLFFMRHPDVAAACVHAFPLFGGIAEWSNGAVWTSYAKHEPGHRRQDGGGRPQWRVLPFGRAQGMVLAATRGKALIAYREQPGGMSAYAFSAGGKGMAIVVTNESAEDRVQVFTDIARERANRLTGELVRPAAMPGRWEVQRFSAATLAVVQLGPSALRLQVAPNSVTVLRLD